MINPNKPFVNKMFTTHPIVLAAITNAHAKITAAHFAATQLAEKEAAHAATIDPNADILEILFGK